MDDSNISVQEDLAKVDCRWNKKRMRLIFLDIQFVVKTY